MNFFLLSVKITTMSYSTLRWLLAAMACVILPAASFAQWTNLNTGTTNDIYCIRYQPSGEVWAGTLNGILRSSNSGASFSFVNGLNASVGNSQIFGTFDDILVTGPVSAVAAGTFYLGNDLIIFGTSNNGSAWTHNFYNNTGSAPRYINAFDFSASGNGVAVGSDGRVYTSANNGSTWSTGSSGTSSDLMDVSWVSGNTFVAASGSQILRSTNNGTSWTGVLSVTSNLDNISFARNSNTGYAGGFGLFYKSTDGGLTWNSLLPPPENIVCLYAFSPDTVYAGTITGLFRSVNGGLYWERCILPSAQTINDIFFYDANNGMLAGNNGFAAVTANGGGLTSPVSAFSLPAGSLCSGSVIQPQNQGSPAWTYQWLLDGVPLSTQYSPSVTLGAAGNSLLQCIATTNGFSDTASINLNILPLPQVQAFSSIRDSICLNSAGGFSIPNSQPLVLYRVFDGSVAVSPGQFGNGDTIRLVLSANQGQVKPYTLRGVFSNACGSDTLEMTDSLYIATIAPAVSAILYRDTICTGDTTTMIISNSEPGWEYYTSNNSTLRVDGNGGTIGIPVGPISSTQTITVFARFKSSNCFRTFPGTQTLRFISTSLNITPGTLQGASAQPISLSASGAGFNSWTWDFGPNANPSNGTGQTPPAPSFVNTGIDTISVTARLNNTCERTIKKAVYIYGPLPASSTLTCRTDTFPATMGNTVNEFHLDDFNNLHAAGFNAQSSNFAFIPHVFRIDTSGIRRHYTSFNSMGNNPGAQGLIHGITSDRFTNTYFTTNYKAPAFYDVQGNYIRTRNALVKLNPKGKFQWAIESPLADFSDMVTVNNRIFAIGTNVWAGCEFQTPAGVYNYSAGISNRGDGFIMEVNPQGEVLSVDAFGSGGNGGVSTPARFRIKSRIMNIYGDYDTLRQNMMVRGDGNSAMIIAGLLDATSIGSPIYFNSTQLSNSLPVGNSGEECLFVTRYDINSGFSDAVTLMAGFPELINDFTRLPNGHIVITGRIRNRMVTSAGVFTFPTVNYDYQFLASFSPAGTLDWMIHADTMDFRAVAANADGSVSLMAVMNTKFLIVDGQNNPYNVSPTPQSGTFLLRFGANGGLLSADRISNYSGLTMKQDACGNLHTFHFTGTPLQSKVIRTIHSNSGSCGSNCYAAYDPNLLDAGLDSLNISSTATSGSSVRDIIIKLKNNGLVPVTALQLKLAVNNDAVQTISWNGSLLSGDTLTLNANAYSFTRSYNRIRVWIDAVNGATDNFRENDTLFRNQIICNAPLAGTYSAGCDTCYFDDMQSSATTLKTCGVSDPVTIAFEPGKHFGQVRIDSIPFASVSDSIVWTSRTGNAEDVSIIFKSDYSYVRGLIKMQSAAYCSFKDLTLVNHLPKAWDNMQADGGRGIFEMDNVHHVNISDCRLFGLRQLGGAIGPGKLIDCYQGSQLRITGNYGENGADFLQMGGSIAQCRNIIIKNNEIRQTNGINLYNVDSLLIDANKLSNIGSGLSTRIICTLCDSFRIVNNQVTSENWSNEVLNINCNCPAANPCLIANNIFGTAPISLPFAGSAIYGSNIDVIHNTFGQGVELLSSGNMRFVNNLVRSNRDFAVEISSSTFFSAFNNNRYQSNGGPLNFSNNGNNYSLSAWRTLTGFDLQSDSVTAEYTTLTDMHIRNSVSMPGVPWPGITGDIDGEPRSLTTPTIGADEYSPNPLLGIVWPGDCDSSKTVDNFDLLPIGLYYNRFGTSRPDVPSTGWAAQASLLWEEQQAAGINLHHADADGDGRILVADTAVVVANYGLSHALQQVLPQRPTNGPELRIVPQGTVYAAGDTVELRVEAGTTILPVQDMAAIGFKVDLPAGLFVPGTLRAEVSAGWMCPDSNCILYARADAPLSQAAISMVRLDGDRVSGSGELARIFFVVNAAFTGSPIVSIAFNDYRAFDPQATPITLSPQGAFIQVTNTAVAESDRMQGAILAPNPAAEEVRLILPAPAEQPLLMQIMDLSGRVLESHVLPAQTGIYTYSCAHLPGGLYFVQLRQGDAQVVLKLVKR